MFPPPNKCGNAECERYYNLVIQELRTKYVRLNKTCRKHIEAQAKIITNLTEQLQVTTCQTLHLTQEIRDQIALSTDEQLYPAPANH